MEQKGHCKHGEFIIREGCPQCIEEARVERARIQATSINPELTEIAATYMMEARNENLNAHLEAEKLFREGAIEQAGVERTEVTLRKADGKVIQCNSVQEAYNQSEEGSIITVVPPKEIEPETALITISPDKDSKVVALYNEGIKLRDYALVRQIKNNEDLVPATDDLTIIAKTKKAIEEYRRAYTDPIRGHLDAVNAAFKEFTEPLTNADTINRDKIKDYRAEIARKQAEAEETNRMAQEVARRQAEQSGTGEFTVDTTPVEVPQVAKHIYTGMGSTSTQKVYKWEIIDFSLVPRDYLIPNASLIGSVVKSSKGSISIPGIKIWVEDTIRVNTK